MRNIYLDGLHEKYRDLRYELSKVQHLMSKEQYKSIITKTLQIENVMKTMDKELSEDSSEASVEELQELDKNFDLSCPF